tara:strand:+ start:74857 stop:77850 length:2994 start_codon:yes stop_codon:yes gene_type:complete
MNNLINYTDYSIGYGTLKVSELVKNSIDNNIPYVSITDEATYAYVPELIKECEQNNLKPIFGTTINLTIQDEDFGSLILQAKNKDGYKEISDIIFSMGEYHNTKKRSIDIKDLLKRDLSNVQIVDGYNRSFLDFCMAKSKNNYYSSFLKKVPNIHFYMDTYLNDNLMEKSKKRNNAILGICKKYNKKLFIGSVSRYNEPKEKVLLFSKLYKYSFYKEKADEIKTIFSNDYSLNNNKKRNYIENLKTKVSSDLLLTTEDINNSFESFNLLENPVFPNFYNDLSLRDLIRDKWKDFKENIPTEKQKAYVSRISKELGIIESMGYDPYFLIFYQEIGKIANEKKMKSTIRGSGASSLVLHVLGLSDIDPVKHNLLFERFLNPERKELPDVDYEVTDLNGVLEEIDNKHGKNVSSITNYSSISKSTVTVNNILETYEKFYLDNQDIQKNKEFNKVKEKFKELFKFLPRNNPERSKISYLVNDNYYWKKEIKDNKLFADICNFALRIEDQLSNKSKSVSSIILSDKPISNSCGGFKLNKYDSGLTYCSDLTKYSAEKFGYLKLDIMSSVLLKNQLNLLNHINSKENEVEKNIKKFNDKNVFDNFSKGLTTKINQINSYIGTEICKEVQPKTLSDLVAILALVRGGIKDENGNKPKDLQKFLDGKNNPSSIHYKHKKLEPILKETYGAIIYEEQIMQIGIDIGNLNFTQADDLRSALKKKRPEVIKQLEPIFMKGAEKNNINIKVAKSIFDEIKEKMDQFSFSKIHATVYAETSYAEMYLKTYYPAEFKTFYGDILPKKDRESFMERFNEEINHLNINFLRPSINEIGLNDQTVYKVINDKEYKLYMESISGLFKDDDMFEKIIKVREKHGFFKGLPDYISRITPLYTGKSILEESNVNDFIKMKNDLEIMIDIGCFDTMYEAGFKNIFELRTTLKNNLDTFIESSIDYYNDTNITIKASDEVNDLNYYIDIEKSILNFSPLEKKVENSPKEKETYKKKIANN